MPASCLVEKCLPETRGQAYSASGTFHVHNPKRFQIKADEYLSKLRSGIAHGKFVGTTKYFNVADKNADKRVVVVDLGGALALANEFAALATEWKRETGYHSSLSKKFTHPAYQRIMAMGKPALSLILRDLRQSSGHWFYALRFIAGEEAKDVAVGADTIEDARKAWLKWGYDKEYI
jgi:hypothetical protein